MIQHLKTNTVRIIVSIAYTTAQMTGLCVALKKQLGLY